jgi:hypothetical protein
VIFIDLRTHRDVRYAFSDDLDEQRARRCVRLAAAQAIESALFSGPKTRIARRPKVSAAFASSFAVFAVFAEFGTR